MNTVSKLTNWFVASYEGPRSTIYFKIVDHFRKEGLDELVMSKIVGPTSMISMISN